MKSTAKDLAGRQPLITTRPLTSGPPPFPNDTDIWTAIGVDANGTRWQFQYRAGSTSAFKWEFVGGSAINADADANETTTSASYVDLTTVQSITLVRAGDYRVTFGMQTYLSAGAGALNAAITKAGVAQMDVAISPPALNTQCSGSRVHGFSAAAGDVLKMQYNAGGSGGTAQFLSRFFGIVPIRIA